MKNYSKNPACATVIFNMGSLDRLKERGKDIFPPGCRDAQEQQIYPSQSSLEKVRRRTTATLFQ
jgi:hypothetical protein